MYILTTTTKMPRHNVLFSTEQSQRRIADKENVDPNPSNEASTGFEAPRNNPRTLHGRSPLSDISKTARINTIRGLRL